MTKPTEPPDSNEAGASEEGREPRSGVYRQEAFDHAREGRKSTGDVLRISPLWLRASYWVVLSFFTAVCVFAVFANVSEYSRGPALIAASTKAIIPSRAPGQVTKVFVTPGQLVRAGSIVVQLDDEKEVAELRRIEDEFDQQLARSLLERNDKTARDQLVSLRAQRDLARARLKERSIRAPRDARISDLRARVGDYLEVGAPIITLLERDPRFRVTALLPGAARPEIQPGMPLRLELTGYPYAYETVRVVEVAQQVVGPREAKRLLGPDLADAVTIDGPVTVVHAEINGTSFTVDGKQLEYHDGMPAVAEVPVRQSRLIVLLAPWLRNVF